MKPMPVTIISNLAISLLITIIVLPVLATYFYKPGFTYTIKKSLRILEETGKKFANWFSKVSGTRRGAGGIVAFFILFFIGAVSLIPLGLIKVDFIGNSDSNNVWINVTYAPGISVFDNQVYTNQLSHDILDYIAAHYPQVVQYISIDIGSQN